MRETHAKRPQTWRGKRDGHDHRPSKRDVFDRGSCGWTRNPFCTTCLETSWLKASSPSCKHQQTFCCLAPWFHVVRDSDSPPHPTQPNPHPTPTQPRPTPPTHPHPTPTLLPPPTPTQFQPLNQSDLGSPSSQASKLRPSSPVASRPITLAAWRSFAKTCCFDL